MSYWDERWQATPEQAEISEDIAAAVARALKQLDNCTTVLDYGAGVGRWRDFWTDRGLSYVAHDTSTTAVDVLKSKGIHVAKVQADIVFTNTVLIHTGDDVIDDIKGLAKKYVVCVETEWTEPPAEPYDHMAYRTLEQYLSLFRPLVLEYAQRVQPHHLLVFR